MKTLSMGGYYQALSVHWCSEPWIGFLCVEIKVLHSGLPLRTERLAPSHHGAGLLHVGAAHSAHTHSLPRLRQGHRLFQRRRVAGRKSAGCDWQLRRRMCLALRGSSSRQLSKTWSEKNRGSGCLPPSIENCSWVETGSGQRQ